MCLLWARLDLLKVASLVVQTVKCLPAMWETQVRSLGWGDPLEKEMATYSSILAWKIPWTEEPGRLQSMGLRRVGHDSYFTSLHLTFYRFYFIFMTTLCGGYYSDEDSRHREVKGFTQGHRQSRRSEDLAPHTPVSPVMYCISQDPGEQSCQANPSSPQH